jgi:hypothetical protein
MGLGKPGSGKIRKRIEQGYKDAKDKEKEQEIIVFFFILVSLYPCCFPFSLANPDPPRVALI